MDVSRAIRFQADVHVSHPADFKSYQGIQGYCGTTWRKNKEIFHLSLNTSTYVVAQAHKQCEVGTVAQFQSGAVAKTPVERVPGAGAPEATEVLRVLRTFTEQRVCNHHCLPGVMKGRLTRWWASRSGCSWLLFSLIYFSFTASYTLVWRKSQQEVVLTVDEPLKSATTMKHLEQCLYMLDSTQVHTA